LWEASRHGGDYAAGFRRLSTEVGSWNAYSDDGPL
jgi:hypothetical protein